MCDAEYLPNINSTVIGMVCVDNASTITAELYLKVQSIKLQPMRYEELC
jgi:hypothetical protein